MSARDKFMDRVLGQIDYSNRIEHSRVKIAVLDTGIDWNDPYIRGAKDRIVDWKNWADDDHQDKDSKQQVHDGAGHGTHVTALLLKTAPEAKVYVSRVANQNGAMISPEMIAKVSLLIIPMFNDSNSSSMLKPFTLFPYSLHPFRSFSTRPC